jgi:hypothetical protein
MSETPNIRVEQEMQLTSPNQAAPGVRVIRYQASDRAAVQGFFDIEINGILRANGIHLMRDRSVQPARLTPLVNNRRVFIPAIEILDDNLRDSLTAAILAAIRAHLETLPPDQRMRPPRQTDKQPQIAPVQAKPASAAVAPVKPKPIHTKPPAGKPKLPPPVRLLANFPRTTS